MNKGKIKTLTGELSISVSDAMRKINENSLGLLFLVDERGSVVACISDGNIRRYILNDGKLYDPAINAANNSPRIARSLSEAKQLYNIKGFSVIPIVDEIGRIIDAYCGEKSEEGNYEKIGVPVVINAGGRGSRLDPFTKVLPKPLIPVGETPIIELIINEFQKYGCDEFHVIVNYKKELIKAYFSDCESKYKIEWYDEFAPLGTGGGLSLLKGEIDSTFFFSNCDILLRSDYSDILHFHRDNHNDVTMICAKKNIDIPYGVVDVDENGTVKNMREKPQLSFLTNTGIYLVEPGVINDVVPDKSIGFPDVLLSLINKGKKVAAYPVYEEEWMDMGQLPELENMRKRLHGEF